jgi:hypothetical protein
VTATLDKAHFGVIQVFFVHLRDDDSPAAALAASVAWARQTGQVPTLSTSQLFRLLTSN